MSIFHLFCYHSGMEKALAWVQENKDYILSDIRELLSIPSISAESKHKDDVLAASEWVKRKFEALGMEAQVFQTKGHPVVYGQTAQDPNKKTVLVYFHYDVQPEGNEAEWKTKPFEPTLEDGKMYGRGTTDDKMQGMIHAYALEALSKSGEAVPVNFKFVIEGEEEVSSPNVMDVIEANADLMKCDYIVISDGPMLSETQPSMEVGARGILYTQLRVTIGEKDMHSGQFGGYVKNANMELAKIISKLKDEDGKITVPGFYDGIIDPTPEELEGWKQLPVTDEQNRSDAGVFELDEGEKGYSLFERNWSRPTLEVNGMWGGFTGEGAKTVIPYEARAKISMRLVPGQDPADILEKFEKHVILLAPSGVKVELEWHEKAPAFLASPDDPVFGMAQDAYEEVYGTKALLVRTGGTIGLLAGLKRVFDKPVLLMNFGCPDEGMHAPNEFMRVDNVMRGIETSLRLWNKLA